MFLLNLSLYYVSNFMRVGLRADHIGSVRWYETSGHSGPPSVICSLSSVFLKKRGK
jgi:hypothetical protein